MRPTEVQLYGPISWTFSGVTYNNLVVGSIYFNRFELKHIDVNKTIISMAFRGRKNDKNVIAKS